MQLLLPTAFGLEAVVAREVRAVAETHGVALHGVKNENGRVLVQTTDAAAIPTFNLHLRTAGRVQVLVDHFPCTDFGTLFDRTVALPWEQGIDRRGRFPVAGRCVRSQLSSEPDAQRLVKKAIATRLSGSAEGRCPEDGATYPVRIAIDRDTAWLTIDTTGEGLHRRGYRDDPGAAGLRETLAASLLQLSHWRPGRPLLDPFCGTGTLLIEAALMARQRAPGLRREFACESWSRLPLSDDPPWRMFSRARAAAEEQQVAPPGEPLIGCDLDERQLERARRSAHQAGVADDVTLVRSDVGDLPGHREIVELTYGCVVTNPPYGQRLEGDDRERLARLYDSLAWLRAAQPTWGHFILTAWPDLEATLGTPADRRRNLYNGPIACTYYQYHGPRPPRPSTS